MAEGLANGTLPPDGIGLYSKNSAVNHLHESQVESGAIVMGAAPLLPVHQRVVGTLDLSLGYFMG
jgi:hypothetical protein